MRSVQKSATGKSGKKMFVTSIVLLMISLVITGVLVYQYALTLQVAKSQPIIESSLANKMSSAVEDAVAGDPAAIGSLNTLRQEITTLSAAQNMDASWKGILQSSQALSNLLASKDIAWLFLTNNKDTQVLPTQQLISLTMEQAGAIGESLEESVALENVLDPDIFQLIALSKSLSLQTPLLYAGSPEMLEVFTTSYAQLLGLVSGLSEADYSNAILIDIQNMAEILEQIQPLDPALIQLKQAQEQGAVVRDLMKPLIMTDAMSSMQQNMQPSLTDHFVVAGFKVPVYAAVISVLLSAVLILLTIIAASRTTGSQQVDSTATEKNRRNEEAILGLLDTMTELAEGNLTVEANVTDDITGAIADSLNFTIEELRGLVSTVNQSSQRVAQAVSETRTVTGRLADASASQARQITEANDTVGKMVLSMNDVSTKTAASADVALGSTEVARIGSERVRLTIAGMDQIREHIQETAKRIKRLGESSQEIGDIVELINDIADQTHILALNAAIQASAAGEAGRGFAVVADEVQRLAERTTNATKRVDGLVKTIQADTNKAILAMEKSTSEVVAGANLAEHAGESLTEIEAVSTGLAQLIQEISTASHHVSGLGHNVSEHMESIRNLTGQNVENTQITSRSVEQLNALASELRQSVAGFRLPA